MKKTLKRFALLSVAMLLGFASCEDPIIEDLVNTDLPTIITNEVSDITANGAKTGGYVLAQGGTEVVARGVCYSTTQNPTVGNSRTEDGQGMGGFTSILTGLTPATTYYIRAYATNQHGTAYGEERSFTTAEGAGDTGDTTQGEDGKPVVTTNQVVAIEYTSAICGGNVVSEELVLARGICWSTSPNPTINNTFTNEGQGAGNFTSRMTELSPNTTYYVRAYATNVNGTSYGEERTFTTNQYSLPIVITSNVTASFRGAQCGGEVNFDGGLEVTGRGVCWSTSPNPTITNDKTTDGSGTGSFNSTIIGLSSNTTYYVRAYATNEIGTAYGEERSFTTSFILNVTFGTQTWYAADCQALYHPNYSAVAINAVAIQGQYYPHIEMCLFTSTTGTYTDAIDDDLTYNNDVISWLEYWETKSWTINNANYGDWWAESATINVTTLDLTTMEVGMNINATMFEFESILEPYDGGGLTINTNLLPSANRRTMTVDLLLPMTQSSKATQMPLNKKAKKGSKVVQGRK